MVVDDCEGPPLWGSFLRVVIDVERTGGKTRDGGRAVETAGVGRYEMVGGGKLLYENIYYISNPQVLEVESREDRPPQMSQMEFLF